MKQASPLAPQPYVASEDACCKKVNFEFNIKKKSKICLKTYYYVIHTTRFISYLCNVI